MHDNPLEGSYLYYYRLVNWEEQNVCRACRREIEKGEICDACKDEINHFLM